MRRLLIAILICSMLLPMCAMAATDADTDFDQDFLSYIHALNAREDYIISPLSLRAALILAVEGANGDTREHLLRAMGFASEDEMAQWYATVRESVGYFLGWVRWQAQDLKQAASYYPEEEAPTLPPHAYRVLNGVWNNTDIFGGFLPDYIRRISERYDATVASVPADQITDTVNQWCDRATDGMIPSISDDLSACAAALVNAVYLKSSWAEDFDDYMTEPEDFTDIDGQVSRRDMMKAKESYLYYEDGDTQLISIPLNGGLTFIAVLGDASDWQADYAAARYTDVDLWLPKLDTESVFGADALEGYLRERGAADAFDANAADFSHMSDQPWYIDSVMQKARIKTDEDGLEAAAVTIVADGYAAPWEEEEPRYREFHADRPFRYYVVTTSTQTPLVVFAGPEAR